MMPTFDSWTFELLLPVVFMVLMGFALLVYVVLDGYDLGVGVLMGHVPDDEKDIMLASIGPFWDANETWLVLGVGLLLVAFPMAHGVVLGELYLPVTLMLFGLILRGVAFDFRVKVSADQKPLWNRLFFMGSVLASLCQGYMLGRYITGFDSAFSAMGFSVLTAFCLLAAYVWLGASWLLMKTDGALQKKAVVWARCGAYGAGLGIVAISVATPMLSDRIVEKWFSTPNVWYLLPIPLCTAWLFLSAHKVLGRLPSQLMQGREHGVWVPFACAVGVLFLSFCGLAYSVFPYLVPNTVDVWQAASHHESLLIIFWGAVAVLPAILGYTVYVYRVFWGKAKGLSYS